MAISVPIAVVQKAGLENAILSADLERAGFRRGVDFDFVEYPQALMSADENLQFVFLGKYWGTATDLVTIKMICDREKPVFVASFDESVVAEGGPCNLRVARGLGDERYRWFLALLNMQLRRAN
jgi:hypothetical protein